MPNTKEIRLVHTRFTNADSTNLTDLSSTVSRQAPLPSSQTLGLTENGNTLTPQITVKWDVPQLYRHIKEVPYGGGHTGGAFFHTTGGVGPTGGAFFHTTGGVGPTGGQRWPEYPYRTVYYEMDKTLELTYPLPSIETPDLHPAEEEMNVDLMACKYKAVMRKFPQQISTFFREQMEQELPKLDKPIVTTADQAIRSKILAPFQHPLRKLIAPPDRIFLNDGSEQAQMLEYLKNELGKTISKAENSQLEKILKDWIVILMQVANTNAALFKESPGIIKSHSKAHIAEFIKELNGLAENDTQIKDLEKAIADMRATSTHNTIDETTCTLSQHVKSCMQSLEQHPNPKCYEVACRFLQEGKISLLVHDFIKDHIKQATQPIIELKNLTGAKLATIELPRHPTFARVKYAIAQQSGTHENSIISLFNQSTEAPIQNEDDWEKWRIKALNSPQKSIELQVEIDFNKPELHGACPDDCPDDKPELHGACPDDCPDDWESDLKILRWKLSTVLAGFVTNIPYATNLKQLGDNIKKIMTHIIKYPTSHLVQILKKPRDLDTLSTIADPWIDCETKINQLETKQTQQAEEIKELKSEKIVQAEEIEQLLANQAQQAEAIAQLANRLSVVEGTHPDKFENPRPIQYC